MPNIKLDFCLAGEVGEQRKASCQWQVVATASEPTLCW